MNEQTEPQENSEQLVAVINRSPTQQIQIRVNEFKGKRYVDLRTFYLDDKDETYKPTRKGVSVPVENFEDLKAALAAVDAAL